MVQIVKGGASRSSMLADILGQSLGEGIGNMMGNYQATKSLDAVRNDKSLMDALPSERISRLEAALRPHGERGMKMLQAQMGIEQQRAQEEQSRIIAKMQRKDPLTEREERSLGPELQIAYTKATAPPKKTQSSQPIDPEQMEKIQKVRSLPNFDEMSEVEQYRALTDAGVSKENAVAEASLRNKQLERSDKKIDASFKAQEDFISKITSSYRGFEDDMKPRLLQMQKLASDNDLIGPTSAVFLESLGIPLGALDNPDSELFDKLSQDLLKGLPETYGNRIMKIEVENFLKTIPRLTNSPDGRRMIASNFLKLGEMKEVYYNEMRRQQKAAIDQDRPLPRDFEQRVFDTVKPQIDRLNEEFVKLSEIKSVPPGEIPFFDPNGNVVFIPKQHVQWATENHGKRIW